MSSLAGLVEKGRVASDWAEALGPVDDRIRLRGEGHGPGREQGRLPPLHDHVDREGQDRGHEQHEADQDARDSDRVVDENRQHDPDHDQQ